VLLLSSQVRQNGVRKQCGKAAKSPTKHKHERMDRILSSFILILSLSLNLACTPPRPDRWQHQELDNCWRLFSGTAETRHDENPGSDKVTEDGLGTLTSAQTQPSHVFFFNSKGATPFLHLPAWCAFPQITSKVMPLGSSQRSICGT
jgi:hypothetical protein